ncbi:hypothetical protein ACFQ05_38310 [Amycolatopsis umgeniensis]|uniref:Uncharacterized protein n=1 Tax=Amycolatopsis umgeniensis TaxID=336628 RepID=A0A841AYD1_9PSEU|nr:hypothetical protein [Amycolatopsis umgeniensis]MBB5851284.1 hypothetical protein [Amycolatopsis umgeniensis]
MNIKRAGVIGVAGLTTAAVGAWTFGAFEGGEVSASPANHVAAAPNQAAAPVAPPVQKVASPAVVPAAAAAKPVQVKKVARVTKAKPVVKQTKKKVHRQKASTPVVKTATAKDVKEVQPIRFVPRVVVVEKPTAVPSGVKKAAESLAKAEKLVDQAKNEVKKAKDELKKLKSAKHSHRHQHQHQHRHQHGKAGHRGSVSVDSKGLKPGQSRTASTSSPDGSSWSSATVSVK